MDARPYGQVDMFELLAQLMCGFDGTTRSIEDGEQSVAGAGFGLEYAWVVPGGTKENVPGVAMSSCPSTLIVSEPSKM